FEDIDILVNVDHFTKLHKMGTHWYNRLFVNGGVSKQVRPLLNPPLFIRSKYGLPYFQNGLLEGDLRSTLRTELVFFNMKKYVGFRTAPFIFADMCLLRPVSQAFSKSDFYSALG